MPAPRSVARFNRRVTNQVLRPLARKLPHFGVIEHRGRKTGRVYHTPVNLFARPGGYMVALTYGPGDWVQNVLCEGGCVLETQGRTMHLKEPRLIHDEGRRAVPRLLRPIGRLGDVADFLYLNVDPERPR